MIYILDNGADYSAHGIFFVEVPETLMKYKAQIESMLLRAFSLRSSYYEPKILGTSDRIDWWQGGTHEFSQHLGWYCFIEDWYERCGHEKRWVLPAHPDCQNQEPRDFYKTDFVPVPDEVMTYLLEKWRGHRLQLDDEPSGPPDGEDPWLSRIFNIIEEVMKGGELR